jgi:hypothetical protein
MHPDGVVRRPWELRQAPTGGPSEPSAKGRRRVIDYENVGLADQFGEWMIGT